jgi:alpha-mannosidase
MYFIFERIGKICEELKEYIYRDAIKIETCYIKEGNFRSPEEADNGRSQWREFKNEATWGGFDSHSWFKADFIVPKQFENKAMALRVSTGSKGWDATNPQFMLYINSILVQGLDVNHCVSLLSYEAIPGDLLRIDLHAYSGMVENKHSLNLEAVLFDERIKELYYNIQVPLAAAEQLPDNNIDRMDILKVLNEAVNIIDLRKPFSESFYNSVEKANDFMLTNFYEQLCGRGKATATCVGHTHIDVAWLWTLGQTREKVARSFSTVLKLMEEYPEYIFMSSQPQLYKYLKEDHPEIYARVKEMITSGRWEADGAMWVEADCNLASGEALVRQILFGTRFFKEEFGVENLILWLPDVFGYSASLPQIMKKSGIKYFMTTKINWNQFNQIPNDTFMWRGIDDSEVLTHFITTPSRDMKKDSFFTTYNGILEPHAVMGGWERYKQKDLDKEILIAYGYGDGGGGATAEMLENARRMSKGIPGCPTVVMGKAIDFFKGIDSRLEEGSVLPKWVGELYLEFHRGTYTSMGRNKRYNRKSEFLYQDAELLSSLANGLGLEYPQKRINNGWETILLNQFHDILPGSSIKEVYDESREQYEAVIAAGKDMMRAAVKRVCGNVELKEASVVVFNTLGFERSDLAEFEVPDEIESPGIYDQDSEMAVPVQVFHKEGKRKALFFAQRVPAKGYKSFMLRDAKEEYRNVLEINESKLENKFFRIEMGHDGSISRIYDKRSKREVLKKGKNGNVLKAYEDKPMSGDNWNIDIYYTEKMWIVSDVKSIDVVECGPVRGCLRICKRFLDSDIVQNVYIYADIPRIDFDTYIDWKEDQVLLKAEFPVDIHAVKAAYDIQYGNIERSAHANTSWDIAAFEVCAHKWADLSEDDYGVSLLNDCKYGHDIKDGNMRLTLIKSGIEPYKKADREEHFFTYSLYPHQGGWRQGKTVQAAYNLNVPFYASVEAEHAGVLPMSLSIAAVDSENVIIEVVKKAEDDGDTIVRMYECYNRKSDVKLTYYKELQKVFECDLLENELQPVTFCGNEIVFQIKPYEIKTFKLKHLN